MISERISRRNFVKGSLSALALTSLSHQIAFCQTIIRTRTEWQDFRSSSDYSSFIDAIRIMRANTDANDRSSWRYWINVHVNYCPHDIDYFLAWHRGYLYYFERQLRIVSGNNNLTLPYWNYYRNPRIPAEFTDPATGNPLYVTRVNTNVYNALSLAPFGSNVWNFERERANAFEPLIESRPHNGIHNIIGGSMGSMESPTDPIFYLHHANIDRLWYAWSLPDGKGIPGDSSSYWEGSFTYAPDLILPRAQCYHPSRLGFTYSDLRTPITLPQEAKAARMIRVQAQTGRTLQQQPVGAFPTTPPKSIGSDSRSLGGAKGVMLTEHSVSVRVPILPEDSQILRGIITRYSARDALRSLPEDVYKSVQIVLDEVRVLEAGRMGGYFYNVSLNLTERDDISSVGERHFLGTVGPFEIEAASHHGSSRLTFPVTDVLANKFPGDIKAFTVSLERVSGENSPRGRAIEIGELRVEILTKEPIDTRTHVPKPENKPFR